MQLLSADGLPIGLMAVADGHGSTRYWLSDVGSRLGCELALTLAAKDLAQRWLSDPSPKQHEAMHTWLANDLPKRLLTAWGKAIEADWQQRELPEAHRGESFSNQTYGTTLALVVLTPNWWAHTGLGDWDLVRLSNQHPDKIISQEATEGFQGEATQSLCLPHASHCFKARTAVYALGEDRSQGFGLVLSTDGIRKSCASDGDYLTLSRYLFEEAQLHQAQAVGEATRLDSSLDRISREGSGDDVSVALACFGLLKPIESAGAEGVSITITSPELPPLPPLPNHEIKLPTMQHSRPLSQDQWSRRKTAHQIGYIACLMVVIGAVSFATLAWLKTKSFRSIPAPSKEQASLTLQLPISQ